MERLVFVSQGRGFFGVQWIFSFTVVLPLGGFVGSKSLHFWGL